MRAHDQLQACGQVVEALLQMSPATIDRRLKPYRAGLLSSCGMSHTRPGSLLKVSILMKTWAEWDNTEPGFVQIDLVGHEGGDNNGEFCWSLDMTDIATGWTEAISVPSKGERIVRAGLEQLPLRFPFAILGIHSDNGSEFINHHLQKWCSLHQITYHPWSPGPVQRPGPCRAEELGHGQTLCRIPPLRHPSGTARARPPPWTGRTKGQTQPRLPVQNQAVQAGIFT
ncbi:transposase family protein [Aestuariimicrobium sp. p3-SID1156]|uniref:integrase catalytic domain-containing protein n=1 Tax=Aestuariimicrobium sp. p3-SID1156 TaxID=2916038 RepID=UPI00223C3C41|nr:transposase family protein [Aestuariimicrobium sp. p3-SID1156]MCT1460113.1 transposase family protein [Aestuariimicrobium sp. p3-SID1156]